MSDLDRAQDVLNRMARAHRLHQGVRLTRHDIASLYRTRLGELWSQPDPRAAGPVRPLTSRQAKRNIDRILTSLVVPASRVTLEGRLHMGANSAGPYLRYLQDTGQVRIVGKTRNIPIYGLTENPT